MVRSSDLIYVYLKKRYFLIFRYKRFSNTCQENNFMPLPLFLMMGALTTASIVFKTINESEMSLDNIKTNKLSSSERQITAGAIYGWILEGVRKEWDFTQSEMAYVMGINSKSNYYKIEKCLTEIDINQLYYFCNRIKIPLIEMIALHSKIYEEALKVGITVVIDKKITAIDSEQIVLFSEYLMMLDIKESRTIKKAIVALSQIPLDEDISTIKKLNGKV